MNSKRNNPGELLAKEIRQCTLCTDELPQPPFPILQLDSRAGILLAGQAPGRITREKGIPFDDASGKRLRDWLGVDGSTFYDPAVFAIAPMGFCFPGTGKSGDLPPIPRCADSWRERLMDSLPNLHTTVVIGRYAIDWHLPHLRSSSITEAAAHTREGKDEEIFVVPHPSPRNNRWLKQNPWFEIEVLPRLRARIARHL